MKKKEVNVLLFLDFLGISQNEPKISTNEYQISQVYCATLLTVYTYCILKMNKL